MEAAVETFFLWTGLLFLIVVLFRLLVEDYTFRSSSLITAKGTVFDHIRATDTDDVTYSAQLRFVDDVGRQVEIADTVGRSAPTPPVGTVLTLVYPSGHPEKAVVRRCLLRGFVYAAILFMLAILAGRIAGWLPEGGSF